MIQQEYQDKKVIMRFLPVRKTKKDYFVRVLYLPIKSQSRSKALFFSVTASATLFFSSLGFIGISSQPLFFPKCRLHRFGNPTASASAFADVQCTSFSLLDLLHFHLLLNFPCHFHFQTVLIQCFMQTVFHTFPVVFFSPKLS